MNAQDFSPVSALFLNIQIQYFRLQAVVFNEIKIKND